MTRLLSLLALAASLGLAQMQMSVEQLISFVRSSIELKHDDKQVANYLRKIKLTHKLDARVIEDLRAMGAGPKTYEALNDLREATASLAPPPKQEPKAPRPQIPPPSSTEQARILDEVREYALSYSKRLPDFICTQVTRRYLDPTGLEFWQRQDTITAKLSYFDQREDYQVVMVNNQYMDVPYEKVGGATSSGEFGTLLKELFEPETEAAFQWERWATLRGRRVHVFSYRVKQSKSRWRISWQRQQEIIAGYRGLVYVDRDTPIVHRVTMEAVDIPPSFPIQQASTVLDYDFTKISGNEYVLPLRAEVRMREGKLLVRNEVEFRMYRKFGAEATITFTPDPLPEDQVREAPEKQP